MSKAIVSFTKGIVTGVVVGTTVGMVMNSFSKPAHPFSSLKMKKNAGKIAKNIGTVVSNVTSMIK